MEEEKSVKEILEIALRELEAIRVPISQTNEIARPIWHAAEGIKLCIQALEEPAEEVKENV